MPYRRADSPSTKEMAPSVRPRATSSSAISDFIPSFSSRSRSCSSFTKVESGSSDTSACRSTRCVRSTCATLCVRCGSGGYRRRHSRERHLRGVDVGHGQLAKRAVFRDELDAAPVGHPGHGQAGDARQRGLIVEGRSQCCARLGQESGPAFSCLGLGSRLLLPPQQIGQLLFRLLARRSHPRRLRRPGRPGRTRRGWGIHDRAPSAPNHRAE